MIDQARSGAYAIPILYMDNHLLAAVKPPNMPSQADASRDEDMLTALKRYVAAAYNKPGAAYLGLVHRLDRPAGGVMIFARTSKAAARLSADFANNRVKKTYWAIVQGNMGCPVELTHYLLKDASAGTVREAQPDEPGAKLARLSSAPVRARDGLTLTRIDLRTGRPHQIRVQHMLAGHPVWGDSLYGEGVPVYHTEAQRTQRKNLYGNGAPRQLALWAAELTVTHPTLKTELTFTSAPPQSGIWVLFEDILFSGDGRRA